jgi:hypothetical protein
MMEAWELACLFAEALGMGMITSAYAWAMTLLWAP